jgi:sulfide:quinone oxidoreductase
VAHTLRRLLPRAQQEITLISQDDQFVFIPSLPWVAMGKKTIAQISVPIRKSLQSKGVSYLQGTVEQIDPQAQQIRIGDNELKYDFLVIATGHRSANEVVPGLGPKDGPGHSLMSPPEAQEAADSWQAFLQKPGPIVIGCAPGASCIGPAYEFVFDVDHGLRQLNLRHKVPIEFVTPEPFLGHFGVGGVGRARQFFEGEFERREISYHLSAEVSKINDAAVELAGGQEFESRYSMILPPLSGVDVVGETAGLGNPKGFIPTDAGFRHLEFDNVYAVGVAVALPPVGDTPVPVNFPKTGHMTVQMARAAAHNIMADIKGNSRCEKPLSVQCILDLGDRAAKLHADPVRPPRNRTKVSIGKRWLWAKQAYAPWFLLRTRLGRPPGPW